MIINENMMYADPPVFCALVDCSNKAHVQLYVDLVGWIGICDKCIADLARYKHQRKSIQEKEN